MIKIEEAFKSLYGREPTGLELVQFKSFWKFKKRENNLWGAAKRARDKKAKAEASQ